MRNKVCWFPGLLVSRTQRLAVRSSTSVIYGQFTDWLTGQRRIIVSGHSLSEFSRMRPFRLFMIVNITIHFLCWRINNCCHSWTDTLSFHPTSLSVSSVFPLSKLKNKTKKQIGSQRRSCLAKPVPRSLWDCLAARHFWHMQIKMPGQADIGL